MPCMLALAAWCYQPPYLSSGVEGKREIEMLYMHPRTFLWMQEQDRERMLAQHALERAAQQRAASSARVSPRAGSPASRRLVRKSGSALTHIRLGGAPTST